MDLVTLADMKAFLEIPTAQTTHDALLSTLITRVSARIETFLNRNLEKKARSMYFNAGRKIYFLPAYPIDLASSLSVTYSGTVQTIDDDFFVWEELGKIEFYIETTRTEPKEIYIVWTGGYLVAGLPEDIVLAATMQTAFVFRRRKDIGVNSIALPDGSLSVNVPINLVPEVKSMLLSHRANPGMR